jgi:hypothetical protein
MPLPYDTNALIKQTQDMLAQTKAQGSTSFAGSSYDTTRTGAVPVITPGSMTPATPITTTPNPVTPVPDVSTLQSQIDAINAQYAAPLPNEGNIKTLQQRVMDLSGQTNQEDVRRAQLEADPALQAKRQQVQDLTAQADALVAESKAIPIRIQQEFAGQGVTAGGVAPIQTAQLRNNAIQALSVGSLLSASQGNLSLALDQVDRAVKAEFEPKKAELKTARENLDMLMNDPAISREEKRRADIASATLNWQEAQQAKQEAERKSTLDLAAKLGAYGVDSSILKQIQSAKTFDEAFALAAPYMQDPQAKLALENARLDNEARRADIEYKQKQTRLLGQPTTVTQEKLDAAKKSADAALLVANDQVALIDGLLSSPGLQFAVGPYESQRGGMFVGIPGIAGLGDSVPAMMNKGKTQEFIGAVGQLISDETLKTLLDLKKSGGTLGALSDSERIMLRNAASKIGAWEIEDPKTKQIVGYAVDEDSFKKELRVLQALSRKAATEAAGPSLGADSAEIDKILGTSNISDEELAAYLQ